MHDRRGLERFYVWFQRVWLPAVLPDKENTVFKHVKAFLTTTPKGKRIEHYGEVAAATFAVAAIGSYEHVAGLHQPLTWSLIEAVAVAGGKAVIELAKPAVLSRVKKI